MVILKVAVLTTCFLAFATAGYLVGMTRVKDLDVKVLAVESRLDALQVEVQARQKVGAVILEMDKKSAVQCKHDGPRFIAEDSQGTYCIDCGAKLSN